MEEGLITAPEYGMLASLDSGARTGGVRLWLVGWMCESCDWYSVREKEEEGRQELPAYTSLQWLRVQCLGRLTIAITVLE